MTICQCVTLPVVRHGDTTLLENGCKSEVTCFEGYQHTAGDLVRICSPVNESWDGVAPLCQLIPGLSSTSIMLLIAGPIVAFFTTCFAIDFYFYKKRKQGKRELQGRVTFRELRRVGMVRASFYESLEDPEPPAPTTRKSFRDRLLRFKSIMSFLSFRRDSALAKTEHSLKSTSSIEIPPPKSHSLESGLHTIKELHSESFYHSATVHEYGEPSLASRRHTDPAPLRANRTRPSKTIPPLQKLQEVGDLTVPYQSHFPAVTNVREAEIKRQVFAVNKPKSCTPLKNTCTPASIQTHGAPGYEG